MKHITDIIEETNRAFPFYDWQKGQQYVTMYFVSPHRARARAYYVRFEQKVSREYKFVCLNHY